MTSKELLNTKSPQNMPNEWLSGCQLLSPHHSRKQAPNSTEAVLQVLLLEGVKASPPFVQWLFHAVHRPFKSPVTSRPRSESLRSECNSPDLWSHSLKLREPTCENVFHLEPQIIYSRNRAIIGWNE